MKKLIDKIRAASRQLEAATAQQIADAARADQSRERRRSWRQRQFFEDMRREFDLLKVQVNANTHHLEIQFARMAEMQEELRRLTAAPAPRFRPDRKK